MSTKQRFSGQGFLPLLSLLLALSLLTACTAAEDPHAEWEQLKNQQPLHVEFNSSPSSPIQVGEKVELSVRVLYGEEPVVDADEVLFEIWHEEDERNSWEMMPEGDFSQGMGDTEGMLPYTDQREEVYLLETTFEKPGTYYVMYHVTARNQHNMRVIELLVE